MIGAGITREAGLILVWSPLRADDNPVGRPTRVERFGFTLMIWPLVTRETVVAVVLPWWLVQGALVLLCVGAFVPMKRHLHRVRTGLCWHCGYDIRTTRDRCPECGCISGPLPP